jgi:hypothetical protein
MSEDLEDVLQDEILIAEEELVAEAVPTETVETPVVKPEVE